MISFIDQTTEIFRPADHDQLFHAIIAYIDGDRRHGLIGTWDVSQVTDMSNLFPMHFNEDISEWDTSNVTNMERMFYNNRVFNQDISNWNTGKVTNMENMFAAAVDFNQPLNTHTVTLQDGTTYQAWDVSNVKSMAYMFKSVFLFNQDISNWDASNVTNMREMFNSAESFNQPLITHTVTREDGTSYQTWDVLNVEDMSDMFDGATAMLGNYPNLPLHGHPLPNEWSRYFPRKKPTKSATKLANRPDGPGKGGR